jgi:Holliday junction resolvasome RuvABC endonuclease subunit
MTNLSDFRVDGEAPRRGKPAWDEFVPRGQPGLRVLSIDQSLGHTGWARIRVQSNGTPYVDETGMIETEPTGKDFDSSFIQGVELFRALLRVMNSTPSPYDAPHHIVHEMPKAMGGKFQRAREQNLIACSSVRCAAATMGIPVIGVYAQHAKKELTGNANAEKSLVSSTVKSLMPDLINRPVKPLNYNITDAVAIGLVAIKEMKS